ncbi:amino acid ABC transporter permease [Ralstonia sp.]|uniref:amino acid ABC transporter permease n=1 Tax=Ralstonia sp. TaxID=54061 RepID=UPI0031D4AD31
MSEFSLWDILEALLLSTRLTLELSAVAFIGGGALAIALLLMRKSGVKSIEVVSRAFGIVFQNTPLLMQMFLAYFGIALFGFDVPAWLAAGAALILWSAAYLAEIWRGCVDAVSRGQWEASASLAMSYTQQMRFVILPQAVRLAVAPTVGFSVQIVKSTAIASIVGFEELSRTGATIMNATFEPLTVYTFTAAIYFVICWMLSRASLILERRAHGAHRSR